MKNVWVHFLCFMLLPFLVLAQDDLSKIINLHKHNMEDLAVSRGIETWMAPSSFDESHLIKTLEYFYKDKQVGILIFTQNSDSLNITLLSKKGIQYSKGIKYSKSDIERDVINTNFYFSQIKPEEELIRGSSAKNLKEKTYKNSFIELNKSLFPNEIDFSKFEHLIIVPCLNLGTLPYAAFKISISDYLIDQMSFSIAPSIFEVYVSLRLNSRIPFDKDHFKWKNALFVYKTQFSKSKKMSFSELKYTEQEINRITSKMNPNTYKVLGNEYATKNNVLQNVRDHDLLYFATHGMSSSSNPLGESFLVLSEDKNLQNDLLTASDIQRLRHEFPGIRRAKLVVLSACETGLGQSHKGGIIGLARAFQIAGAQNILMSLWNISDSKTSEFMNIFFDELSRSDNSHLDPHESLKKAILNFRNNVSDNPKFWGAFSLFGLPNPAKETYGVSNQEVVDFYQLKNMPVSFVKDVENEIVNHANYKFSFKLVPVEINETTYEVSKVLSEQDFINERGNFEVKADKDYAILQLTHQGTEAVYIKIMEVSLDGGVSEFFPNENCEFSDKGFLLNPGETVLFKECIFSFGPPFEKYLLRAFGVSNLEVISNENDQVKYGFTKDLIYEIEDE